MGMLLRARCPCRGLCPPPAVLKTRASMLELVAIDCVLRRALTALLRSRSSHGLVRRARRSWALVFLACGRAATRGAFSRPASRHYLDTSIGLPVHVPYLGGFCDKGHPKEEGRTALQMRSAGSSSGDPLVALPAWRAGGTGRSVERARPEHAATRELHKRSPDSGPSDLLSTPPLKVSDHAPTSAACDPDARSPH